MNRVFGIFTSSIRRLILSSFAIVIVLVVVAAMAGYLQLGQVRSASQQIIPTSSQIASLQDLGLSISGLDANLERFFVVGGPQLQENIIQNLQNISDDMESMKQNAAEETTPALTELEQTIVSLETEVMALLEVESTASREINQRILSVYDQIDSVKQLHQALTEETLAQLRDTSQRQETITGGVLTQLLILGLSVSVIAIAASLFVTRSIATPLTGLAERASDIAAGDLTRTVEVKRKDEIGVLAQAFNSMTTQLRELISSLEQRVADRTHELEQRAVQLATAADVGRAATSILDLEDLTLRVVDLVRERFGLYYAALFLIDEQNQYAVLEAGTGEAGRVMKEEGHKLEVGSLSMVGTACALRQARIALDVGAEPVRFDNPLLPHTRSEMALPLMVGDRVVGALDVQSTEQAAFTEEDITILQLVADQVAVAVENARRFSEEAEILEATSPIFRAGRQLASAGATDEIVQAILDTVAETDADGCAIARIDTRGSSAEIETVTFLGGWDRSGEFPVPTGVPIPAQASHLPPSMVERRWTVEDITEDTQMPEDAQKSLVQMGFQAMTNIPLRVGERVIGFVLVYRAAPGAFSAVAVRLYETIADQAAVALERARLLEETQHRAARERMLREITDRMRRATDMDSLMQITVQEMATALHTPDAFVHLGLPPLPTDGNGKETELPPNESKSVRP